MSCVWVKAQEGNKFVLTELGLEVSYIRPKFESNQGRKNQYEYKVPKSWIDSKYVAEVKDERGE